LAVCNSEKRKRRKGVIVTPTLQTAHTLTPDNKIIIIINGKYKRTGIVVPWTRIGGSAYRRARTVRAGGLQALRVEPGIVGGRGGRQTLVVVF